MSEMYLINLSIFQAFLAPVVFFSTLYYLIAFTSIFSPERKARFQRVPESSLPTVSVQLPVYNDPVVARCIGRCLKFDYPREKYRIVVVDDSTDPVTRRIIDNFARKHPCRVVVSRRANRKGWKAGALNVALRKTEEDLIVIFDADFVPRRGFLRRVVQPFLHNNRVAIVQSNTKWLNPGHNIVTRFASTVLYTYYNCVMPIANRVGTAFLGGTGGAIRTSVLKETGGWNESSLTEDSDLSVKLLDKGYKSVYLRDLEVRGEVPVTLGAFVRQQTRWAYGTTRVFVDNWRRIVFGSRFSLLQKLMLMYITLGYLAAPFILVLVVTGNLGWLITPQKEIGVTDIVEFSKNMVLTSGFFLLGSIGLYRAGRISDLPKTFLSMLTVGIVLTATNFAATVRAFLNTGQTWVRTPKVGNSSIYKLFKRIFNL